MNIFIKGSSVFYDEIIEFFTNIGASNPDGLLCNNPEETYFINGNNEVCIATLTEGESWETVKKILSYKDWSPEDKHITSQAEVDKIISDFLLKSRSSGSKVNLRNTVVSIFTDFISNEPDTDKRISYMRAMQSITTVIDYSIYEA